MNTITQSHDMTSVNPYPRLAVHVEQRQRDEGTRRDDAEALDLHPHALMQQETMTLSFAEAIDDVRVRTAALLESFREGRSPFNLEVMVNSKRDVERILSH